MTFWNNFANYIFTISTINAVLSIRKTYIMKFLLAISAFHEADILSLEYNSILSHLKNKTLGFFIFTCSTLILTIRCSWLFSHKFLLFEPNCIKMALLANPCSLRNRWKTDAAYVIRIFTAITKHHACLFMSSTANLARFTFIDLFR